MKDFKILGMHEQGMDNWELKFLVKFICYSEKIPEVNLNSTPEIEILKRGGKLC